MTDNEIIKALECCLAEDGTCDGCAFQKYKMGHEKGCLDYMMKAVLDLITRQREMLKEKSEKITIHRGCIEWQAKEINRQKAEIDTLQMEIKAKKCLILAQNTEIERLQERYDRTKIGLDAVLDERADHSEAIKEFAERLKERGKSLIQHLYSVYDAELFIDNLVKEMVGDV